MVTMDKAELLEQIAKEVRECRKCELWKTRRNAVPGEGNPNAEIFFIGEAPGEQEDKQGRPFVGAAGKLLEKLLESIGLMREDVFIGNVLKCRPPHNRDPTEEEVELCTPFLDRQILAIRPKMIVTLGRHSTRYMFSKVGVPFSSIMRVRGEPFEVDVLGLRVVLFPTLHPAAALYNPRLRTLLEEDFKKIKKVADRGFSLSRREVKLDEFFKRARRA